MNVYYRSDLNPLKYVNIDLRSNLRKDMPIYILKSKKDRLFLLLTLDSESNYIVQLWSDEIYCYNAMRLLDKQLMYKYNFRRSETETWIQIYKKFNEMFL